MLQHQAIQGVGHRQRRDPTVNLVGDGAEGCEFSINLIPHTLQGKTLGTLKPGQAVNLAIDLIARYVERMLSLR